MYNLLEKKENTLDKLACTYFNAANIEKKKILSIYAEINRRYEVFCEKRKAELLAKKIDAIKQLPDLTDLHKLWMYCFNNRLRSYHKYFDRDAPSETDIRNSPLSLILDQEELNEAARILTKYSNDDSRLNELNAHWNQLREAVLKRIEPG